MNNVVEIIPVGNTVLPVVAETDTIDLLNRQNLIDQIIQLLNVISDKRSACTFALNGAWGTGKTFVLNKLMKQLLDYQDGEKFFVFHYNCWQYDYYEEPLIAIVAAMLDSVDCEKHLFSKSLRDNAKKGMAAAKPILEKIAKEFVKKKIGVDLTDLISLVKDSTENPKDTAKQIDQNYAFDEHYSFKKAIITAQEGLRDLCKSRTVVVIVDELDRCLPSYAIKVMERLHHLFSDIPNVGVILAVDKLQLNQTVKQIFGEETDTQKYLKKFIDFELELNIGRIEGGFIEKYADYFSLFDKTLIDTKFSFEAFFSALFADIDIRTQEHLIERIKIVHTMLFPDVKKDYSFLCFELMWIVFTDIYGLNKQMPIVYSIEEYGYFSMLPNTMPVFSAYLEEMWKDISVTASRHLYSNQLRYTLSDPVDIPQLLIWYLYQMYPDAPICYKVNSVNLFVNQFTKNLDDLKEVDKLLKIIK